MSSSYSEYAFNYCAEDNFNTIITTVLGKRFDFACKSPVDDSQF